MSARPWQRQHGAVLLVVLVCLTVIAGIGVTGLVGATFQARVAGSLQNQTQVFAATMAALQRCEYQVREHGSTATGTADADTYQWFIKGLARKKKAIDHAGYFAPKKLASRLAAQGATAYQLACLIEFSGPVDLAQIGGSLRRPLPVHYPVVYTVTARGARVPVNATNTHRPSVVLQSRVVLRRSIAGKVVHGIPTFTGHRNNGYAILPGAAGDAYRDYVRSKTGTTSLLPVGGAGDGVKVVADAWLHGQWATVTVTTLGQNGKGVVASGDVSWQMTPQTVANRHRAYLGKQMGRAAVVRLENGRWVALFGNGYDSAQGTAALIVVALATGNILKVLDTGVGPRNGLSAPLAIDRDRNGSVDTVYAGDLQGNLWQFDLSADSVGWTIAHDGQPLFTAVADDGTPQPITVRPEAVAHPEGGVLVIFGTGRIGHGSPGASATEQSIYGIWDPQGVDEPITAIKQLVVQTVRARTTVAGQTVRVLTDKTVDYGTDSDEDRGWVVDLTRPGERVVRGIRIFDGKATIVTTIPDAGASTAGSQVTGDSALFQLNPLNGSQFQQPILDVSGDQAFDSADGVKLQSGQMRVYPGVVDLDVGLASRPFVLIAEDGSQTIVVTGSGQKTGRWASRSFLQTGRASWVRRR